MHLANNIFMISASNGKFLMLTNMKHCARYEASLNVHKPLAFTVSAVLHFCRANGQRKWGNKTNL